MRSVDAAKVQKQFNQVSKFSSIYIGDIFTVQSQVPFSYETSHKQICNFPWLEILAFASYQPFLSKDTSCYLASDKYGQAYFC